MTEHIPLSKRHVFWLSIIILFFVFIFLIRSILLPFVLGILTAYFLDPAADKLEKSGFSRGVSTMVITVCFFLSILLLGLIIVPIIANQFSGLIAAMPEYINTFEQKYSEQIALWLGTLPEQQILAVKNAVSNVSGVMVKVMGDFLANLFQSGRAVVNLLALILITPVVAFYLLRDWDRLVARMDNLLPRRHADTIREQMRIIDFTLAGFLRGQLNVCLLMGMYYAIGLSLVGLKFGIVIGLATGFFAIFPYIGFTLGMITGLAVAFFQFDDFIMIAAVFGVFMTGQALESYFVTPKLVGEKVGLHPVWIIFGMLVGATLFGFVGVLLAVPLTAVIGVLIRFAISRYLQSPYYQG